MMAGTVTGLATGDVVYVYYKVPLAEHATRAQQVRACQARLLACWPSLTAELLQRPEASNGMETWMETYRSSTGLSAELVAGIAQAAQDAGLPSPRHVETFIALR